MIRMPKVTAKPSMDSLRYISTRPKKYRRKMKIKPMATALSWSSMMSIRPVPSSLARRGVELKTDTTDTSMRNRAIRRITLSPVKRSMRLNREPILPSSFLTSSSAFASASSTFASSSLTSFSISLTFSSRALIASSFSPFSFSNSSTASSTASLSSSVFASLISFSSSFSRFSNPAAFFLNSSRSLLRQSSSRFFIKTLSILLDPRFLFLSPSIRPSFL